MTKDDQEKEIKELTTRIMCMRFPGINALCLKDAGDIARVAVYFLCPEPIGEESK